MKSLSEVPDTCNRVCMHWAMQLLYYHFFCLKTNSYLTLALLLYTFCHTSRGREDNTGYFTFISERQIYTNTQLPLKLLLLLLLLSTETITSIQTITGLGTETIKTNYYGQGAQVRQFNFHTAPELCKVTSSMLLLYDNRDSKCYCY